MSVRAILLAMTTLLLAQSVGAAPPEDERPQRVRAERPGKPTGPIAVDHRLAGVPQVGVPLTISITARAASTTTLTLEATAGRPAALLVAAPGLVSAEPGRFEWTIEVVPLSADAGFLNVVVAGEIDGTPQARSVAIPLRVVADSVGRAPAPGADEALIALPVDEGR